jgi:hypothetical protein
MENLYQKIKSVLRKPAVIATLATTYLIGGFFAGAMRSFYDNQICHIKPSGKYLVVTESDGDKKQFLKYEGKGKYVACEPDEARKKLIEKRNSCLKAASDNVFNILFAPGFIPGYIFDESRRTIDSAIKDGDNLTVKYKYRGDIECVFLPRVGKYLRQRFFNQLLDSSSPVEKALEGLIKDKSSETILKHNIRAIYAGDEEEIKRILRAKGDFNFKDSNGRPLNKHNNCICEWTKKAL